MDQVRSFAIVAPCYNEREGIVQYLDELESTLSPSFCRFSVFIVDDGSNDGTTDLLNTYLFDSILFSIDMIRLDQNVGHQAAIQHGLKHVDHLDLSFDGIIIMDCDGEDDPMAIMKMIEVDQPEIVFVERGKRHENIRFRLSYLLYKILFQAITGRKINFGNFSMISSDVLHTISHQHYRHYASFLSKQNFKIDKIKVDKRVRNYGKSKMNYKTLVYHGIYSIIE